MPSAPLPLVGKPDRDPFAYGLLALEQIKAQDITFHRDDADGAGTPGPACHLGTNCNTTSENGPIGVVILNRATFPPGSQIVAGKTKWRSKSGPALVDRIFANDWVSPGGDKVCNPAVGRQLWCPTPLLRHRYPACPNDCAQDPQPHGETACFCNDSCHILAHWDEMTGGSGFASGAFGELVVDQYACGVDPAGICEHDPVTVASGGTLTLDPAQGNCFEKIVVSSNATLRMKHGAYAICTLTVEKTGAAVEFVPDAGDPPNPSVTVYARNVSVGNDSGFFWTDDFHWVGSAASLPPTNVRVGIFGPGSLGFGQNARVQGTFMAPTVHAGLGTASHLRGRFIAKRLIGQPGDLYCACRDARATCSASTDCCSGTCQDGRCCLPEGSSCGVGDQCCSGSCTAGTCDAA